MKILLGLVLVPVCLGFTRQLGTTVFSVAYKADAPYVFLAGGLVYLTVHLLFRKPIFTYVIGHELTHALFAMLFGGSVKSLSAGERGGRVTVTKSNFMITLAPYFFPLYTAIAMACYGAATAWGAGATATNMIIFVSGAAFSFHLVLTSTFLLADQTDIIEQGAAFSYPLIYLFNVVFAAFLINVYLAENMDYVAFIAGGLADSANMVAGLARKAYAILR
ncbi:MAG TPA: hypothetical protein VLG39_11610 [Nitrospirota bacterium]|nr:hypothetical protein [Nitrospirota bacterium]